MLLGVNYSTGAVFNATPDGELRDIGHWFSSEPLHVLPELSLPRISLNKNVCHTVELYRGMVRGWVRDGSRVRGGRLIKMLPCYVWPQCGTISGYG